MKISPLDIHQQQFKGKLFRGLDPEDVDGFLQMVAQEMEDLIRDNTDLREQVQRLVQEKEELRQREDILRETMLAAQKITEEMKVNSLKEAKLIVSEAELKAEKIIAAADQKVAALENQIQDLKRERTRFESAFKSLLDSHYKVVSSDGQ